MHRVRMAAAGAIAMSLTVPAAYPAQSSYPERPIRLVIGSAAGSGPDIISRVVGERLSRAWGQHLSSMRGPGWPVPSVPSSSRVRHPMATLG